MSDNKGYSITINCTPEGVLSLATASGDGVSDVGAIDLTCTPSGFRLTTSKTPALQAELRKRRDQTVADLVAALVPANEAPRPMTAPGQYL